MNYKGATQSLLICFICVKGILYIICGCYGYLCSSLMSRGDASACRDIDKHKIRVDSLVKSHDNCLIKIASIKSHSSLLLLSLYNFRYMYKYRHTRTRPKAMCNPSDSLLSLPTQVLAVASHVGKHLRIVS